MHDNERDSAGDPHHRSAWEGLAAEIERHIWGRSGGRICELSVSCSEEDIILEGRCRTYHAKQLAHAAALDWVDSPRRLINHIAVL
jgi:hypothetical protein